MLLDIRDQCLTEKPASMEMASIVTLVENTNLNRSLRLTPRPRCSRVPQTASSQEGRAEKTTTKRAPTAVRVSIVSSSP